MLVDWDASRTLTAADYAVRVDTPEGGAFGPSWFAAGELPRLGTAGNDVLVADGPGGTVLGLGGDDTLYTRGPAGTLAGGAGNDLLVALPTAELGLPTLLGEAGDDTYVVHGHAAIHEAVGEGFDTAWLSPDEPARPIFLNGEVELVRLLAAGRAVGSHLAQTMSAHAPDTTLEGGGGDDALWGDDARNVLVGGAGDDVLRGGAGHDTLEGGAGADQLVGGAGRDLFVFREAEWSPDAVLRDQIFDFVRGEDLLLIAAGGADPLANLIVLEIGANTQIVSRTTGAAVDLYGVTGLTAADFAPIL